MHDVTGDLVVNEQLTIPATELAWRFSRSSGPGGQSVNTTDSRVELRWDPATSHVLTASQRTRLHGLFTVVASEYRTQLQNRQAARHRLAERVDEELTRPRKHRRRTRPTKASVKRRLDSKRKRSQTKANRRRPAID